MGHREDVWQSKIFHKVLLSGLSWAAGNVEHDVAPNLEQVAPDALSRLSQWSGPDK
jgi:type 1 glutamine amidotransferase